MSTDTKPADVLAVIEKHIQWTICRCVQSHCDIYERCPERLAHEEAIKARAAVADLITACRLYYAAGVRCSMESSPEATESLMLSAVAIFKAMDRIA